MEQKPSTAQIAIKWGIISALILSIISTGINLTDLWKNSWASLISILPMILFLWLAMKEFKSQNNEYMTYGEGLSIGLLIGAISGIISAVYSYIYGAFIDPGFKDRLMDFQIEKFEESGLSDEQIDAAVEMSSKFSGGGLQFVGVIISMLIMTFIISLVVAAILQKKKPVFN